MNYSTCTQHFKIFLILDCQCSFSCQCLIDFICCFQFLIYLILFGQIYFISFSGLFNSGADLFNLLLLRLITIENRRHRLALISVIALHQRSSSSILRQISGQLYSDRKIILSLLAPARIGSDDTNTFKKTIK